MKFSTKKHFFYFLLILLFFSILNLSLGPYNILEGIKTKDKFLLTVILDLRLPHIILAFSSGVLLSISGSIFQSIFSNQLVDPYIIGVSGGAASFVLLSNLIGIPQAFPFSTIFAFTGGIFNSFLVYFLSSKNGKVKTENLLLNGIILNGFYSAFILFCMALLNALELNRFIFWMMGSFHSKTISEALLLLILTLIFVIPVFFFHRGFDLISLGNEIAKTSGLHFKNFLFFSFLIASILASLSVSFVGIIGFIGLIIPNMVRNIFGSKQITIFSFSLLLGPLFLILADTITRFKFFENVPIGAISAMVGVPFFIYLLRKDGSY